MGYRLRCAWHKFHLCGQTLSNKHVDIRLRLRLFDCIVTPTIMYGLTTAPLIETQLPYLASTQRRMLRLIVGYVKLPEDDWADMCRRLRHRVERATKGQNVRDWVETLEQQKRKLQEDLEHGRRCPLVCTVAAWCPTVVRDEKQASTPRRRRGRPRITWKQCLR